jgi:N-hydroxyarylamine O-acetyltransferase
MSFEFDLNAYAERIGYRGDFSLTWDCLLQLLERHTVAIPFENLDVVLHRGIPLEPERLQEKLIHQRRGGYCFEQNGLLFGILQQIGFQVRPLSGRVRLETGRASLPPRTHLFILLKYEQQDWLVDVGVGGFTLTKPIRFLVGAEQETLHETRRIVHEGDRYYHQAFNGTTWIDVYDFTGEEMPAIDQDVANWWTSTKPGTKFKANVMASRAGENGERFSLLNNRFTHRRMAQVLQQKELQSMEELLETLKTHFGIELPGVDDLPAVNLVFPQ